MGRSLPLRRLGLPEDALGGGTGVAIESQRLLGRLGQALLAQLNDVDQRFLLLLTARVIGLGADVAHTAPVELELRTVLEDDQRIREAAERDALAFTDLVHLG